MIQVIKYDSLGQADYGWLKPHYHFSFSNYYDPKRMGFGKLRVVNDDIIKAGAGFDTHPHRDMEIITYVRQGAISHKDSQGNEGRTGAGDVQVMSAGSGIFHSEFNCDREDTQLYQIWIEPKVKGVKPRWEQRQFPKEPVAEALSLLVSGDPDASSLFIHQDACIYGGRLREGTQLQHPIKHQAYVLVSFGSVEIEGKLLEKGDALAVQQLSSITLHALTDAEVLVLDVPA